MNFADQDELDRKQREREKKRAAFKRDVERRWDMITAGSPIDEPCVGCGEKRGADKLQPFPVYATPKGNRCKDCFMWAELAGG